MRLTGKEDRRWQAINPGTLAIAAAVVMALPSAAHAGILSNATAGPDRASGAAVDLGDGLVVLGGSRSDAGETSWDAVAIGGETVIGRQATPGGAQNEWTGLLAGIGPTVDDLNAATCDGEASHCVAVLPGSAYANADSGGANGSLALIIVSNESGSTGFIVGNSQALRADSGCAVAYADARPRAYAINDDVEVVDESIAGHDDC